MDRTHMPAEMVYGKQIIFERKGIFRIKRYPPAEKSMPEMDYA
jgi:hypothetical protein